jgi:hypothetical protein
VAAGVVVGAHGGARPGSASGAVTEAESGVGVIVVWFVPETKGQP